MMASSKAFRTVHDKALTGGLLIVTTASPSAIDTSRGFVMALKSIRLGCYSNSYGRRYRQWV